MLWRLLLYKTFEDATTQPGDREFAKLIQFINVNKFAL